MMLPLINPYRINKKHSAHKYARGHGVSGSLPSLDYFTPEERAEYKKRLSKSFKKIKAKHLRPPKGHIRFLRAAEKRELSTMKSIRKNARRSKLQVITRKARARKGLAFKSADLMLDKKILREIRSLKKSIKGAAKSGPHSSTTHKKESAMARRKRRNPAKYPYKLPKDTAAFYARMKKGKKKASKVKHSKAKPKTYHKKVVVMSAKTKRKAVRYRHAEAHRPVVYKIHGKFYRRRNRKGHITSRFFGTRRSVRINGRRRHARRNPFNFSLKSFINKALLMRVGGLAAGFTTGAILMPLVSKGAAKLMPNTSVDRYLGGVHVILGGLLMWKGRKAMVKDFGTTLMASGVYDLIASLIGDKIGLKPFTRDGNFLTQAVGLGASYTPRRLSSSYEAVHAPMAASYQMPKLGASYGSNVPQAGLSSDWGDDPYETCFE